MDTDDSTSKRQCVMNKACFGIDDAEIADNFCGSVEHEIMQTVFEIYKLRENNKEPNTTALFVKLINLRTKLSSALEWVNDEISKTDEDATAKNTSSDDSSKEKAEPTANECQADENDEPSTKVPSETQTDVTVEQAVDVKSGDDTEMKTESETTSDVPADTDAKPEEDANE